MNRHSFLKKALLVGGTGMGLPYLSKGQASDETFTKAEISEFVGAAHKDFDACKRIVDAKPLLLNCTNQRKKGDFETALGGASHMGRLDIAEMLISKGARMDIFSHAFLGHGELVRSMINSYPNLLYSPGPHGFTLLHHAEAGKHQKLSDWLREQGLKETFFKGAFG